MNNSTIYTTYIFLCMLNNDVQLHLLKL